MFLRQVRGKSSTLCKRLITQDFVNTSEKTLYPGSDSNFTHELKYIVPHELPSIPTFRIMDKNGVVRSKQTVDISDEKLVEVYKKMFLLSQMDKILLQSQRQGRISFYMTCSGEEASIIGSAAGLEDRDTVFTQYREVGVFLYRGFSLDQIMNQCFSTHKDNAKGRQMPIHYSSKQHNIQCVSSTLGTQVPNAVGYAYANQLARKNAVTATYFGEGAASEGDVHAAMNMAATLHCPTLFLCRNNGYAISTSTADQYAGDGIAIRGIGYGMRTVRVDGNDVLAVYHVVRESREVALRESCPVLIELMTYRVGHHSTSDDSTAYRSIDEVNYWHTEDSPVGRLGKFLKAKGLWTDDHQTSFSKQCRKDIMGSFKSAENNKKPSPYWLFDDVYDEHSTQLLEQRNQLREHLHKYGDNYNLDNHYHD